MRKLTEGEIQIIHNGIIEMLKTISNYYVWKDSKEFPNIASTHNKALGDRLESFTAYVRGLGEEKDTGKRGPIYGE